MGRWRRDLALFGFSRRIGQIWASDWGRLGREKRLPSPAARCGRDDDDVVETMCVLLRVLGHTKVGRDPQRAPEERPVANRVAPLKINCCRLILFCESLSMKFQASRFSASGRRVPLEPRSARRTAYASPCMFSRLERDVVGVFCWVVPMRRSVTHVWGCDPRPVATTFVENMSCDHMFYFAPSRQPPAAIA